MAKKCEKCGQKRHMFPWETECYSCGIKQQIKDGEITEISCEDEIYCPHCGEDYEIDVDNCELYVEGEYELVCYECRKPFSVEVRVSYSYSTYKK